MNTLFDQGFHSKLPLYCYLCVIQETNKKKQNPKQNSSCFLYSLSLFFLILYPLILALEKDLFGLSLGSEFLFLIFLLQHIGRITPAQARKLTTNIITCNDE